MKERKRIVLILLLSIFILNLINTVNVLGEQIVLNNNNKEYIIVDITGNGDYKSIMDAIDNAQSDYTIFIKKGEYSEIINIKKQINLIGEDRENTLINTISTTNKYAINIGASGTKIQHLTIKNSGPGIYTSGIRITASNTEINNCKIFETPIGIAIWTSNNVIKNCIFEGCKDEGIALLGTSNSQCNNNKILNCIFQENCDGIELQYASKNTIENCEFYNNTHSGIDAICSQNNENIISNCKIINNNVHGIYFSSSSNNKIVDCTIANNKNGNIILLKNSENNEIINVIYEIEQKTEKITEQTTTLIREFQQRFLRNYYFGKNYESMHWRNF
jgi:parallel beta-helix repeat protein